MEEENDDLGDDEANQRLTPVWTESATRPEDKENKGNDLFKEAENAHQEKAAYVKQDSMEEGNVDGNEDVDEDIDAKVVADVNVYVDVDRDPDMPEMNDQGFENKIPCETQDNMSTKSTPNWLEPTTSTRQESTTHLENEYKQMVVEKKKDTLEENDANMEIAVDLSEQDGICALTSTPEWTNSEAQQDMALQKKMTDLKGKEIVAEEEPITLNVIEDDAMDVVKKQQHLNVVLCQNAASTSQNTAATYQNGALPYQNADTLKCMEMGVMTSTLHKPVDRTLEKGQAREEHIQARESRTLKSFAPVTSSQKADKIHMLNFINDVEMDGMASTPDWPMPRDLSPEEKQALEEQIKQEEKVRDAQAQEQYGSRTPNWFAPASSFQIEQEQVREVQAQEQNGSRTLKSFAPVASSQKADKIHVLNFINDVEMDGMASTPDWPIPRDLSPEEKQALEEQIKQEEKVRDAQAQEQYGSRTPNWFAPASSFQNAQEQVREAQAQKQCGSRKPKLFAPASSFQNADKIHMLNFMDDVAMDGMTSTPDWRMPRDLSPEEKQALEEQIKQEEEAQAQEQYTSGTPDWFAPATNEQRNRNGRMKETRRRVQETIREEMEDMTHAKLPKVPQGTQKLMYPLPDMARLLKLPIYNTYHHHHVHELRKGNFDRSCPRSTSTDPSYHTHTSQHRPMKLETRFFTFNCDSSVVAYFRNNKVNIRITSTQLATYTIVVVKQDLLEFVHHIVHRHDVHIVNPKYRDYFNLTSVCSQTCTRTKTQCRLFGSVGDFFHTHFHEFIHTLFVNAPAGEDATVYGEYLHLGTIRRPERKMAENVKTEHERGTGNPSTV